MGSFPFPSKRLYRRHERQSVELHPAGGSAGHAMTHDGEKAEIPVPQGERGMLGMWSGQVCRLPPPIPGITGLWATGGLDVKDKDTSLLFLFVMDKNGY